MEKNISDANKEHQGQLNLAKAEHEKEIAKFRQECATCRLFQEQRTDKIMDKVDAQVNQTTENDKTLALINAQLTALHGELTKISSRVEDISIEMQEMKESIIKIKITQQGGTDGTTT